VSAGWAQLTWLFPPAPSQLPLLVITLQAVVASTRQMNNTRMAGRRRLVCKSFIGLSR
jgi:hypothetical protein